LRNVGFILKQFNLIQVLDALENIVELPLKIGTQSQEGLSDENATTELKLVGLGERLNKFPRQIGGGSGGQRFFIFLSFLFFFFFGFFCF